MSSVHLLAYWQKIAVTIEHSLFTSITRWPTASCAAREIAGLTSSGTVIWYAPIWRKHYWAHIHTQSCVWRVCPAPATSCVTSKLQIAHDNGHGQTSQRHWNLVFVLLFSLCVRCGHCQGMRDARQMSRLASAANLNAIGHEGALKSVALDPIEDESVSGSECNGFIQFNRFERTKQTIWEEFINGASLSLSWTWASKQNKTWEQNLNPHRHSTLLESRPMALPYEYYMLSASPPGNYNSFISFLKNSVIVFFHLL